MKRIILPALLGLAALALAGCGASVNGASTTFKNEADLASTSAPGDTTVVAGTTFDYTITLTNNGPRDATNVPIDLVIDQPDRLALDDSTALYADCTATGGATVGELQFDLAAGTASTDADMPNGSQLVCGLTFYASFSGEGDTPVSLETCVGQDADNADPDPGNNCSAIDATIGAAQPLVDFRDEIIYWAFTDRFNNGDPANDNETGARRGDDAQPDNNFGWHGGDFAGLKAKIDEGYFQSMGFTAIWISPVPFQVPAVNGPNLVDSAGYHGYWAEDWQTIEPHFGTLAELQDLVTTAHAAGLKIILDIVVNHAGYNAQLVDQEPEWFRLGAPGCNGQNNEYTCSIAGLPDLIHENQETTDFIVAQAQYMIDQSGVDGVRWDVMKHVNSPVWSDLFGPGGVADRSQFWSVGEVFDGRSTFLAYYQDKIGSPSVFDFALYFAANNALASRSATTDTIATVFSNDTEYADATRLTTFLDNHDVTRFVTNALDGGASEPQAVERLDMALGLLYGARGIPQVYYGTEIALPGTSEDNSQRDDMDFEAGSGVCAVEDQGQDNSDAYGVDMFLRGGFTDWNATPAGKLVNFGGDVYKARLRIAAGDYGFKVADADWSVEFTNEVDPVVLGTPITLGPGGGLGNTNISLAEEGCYQFELDTTDPDAPVLTVARIKDSCGVDDQSLDNADAYGVEMFARGGFTDWNALPGAKFINFGGDQYQAEFPIAAGDYGFKVADADWSVEFTNEVDPVVLDAPLILGPGGGMGNTNVSLASDACYNFALDTSVPAAPVLTVSVTETTGAAATLIDRLAALAAARQAYPALKRGSTEVLYDPSQACSPQETGNDPAEAFGVAMFARGGFNGWADPPPAGDGFANLGNDIYEARVSLGADTFEYKIAAADWSVERSYNGGVTPLDSEVTLGVPDGNGSITTAEAGCYAWTMDATDTDAPTLVVSQLFAGTGTDVLAFQRDLADENSVVVVLNNEDNDVELSSLNGGLSVGGTFADGGVIEITGADNNLSVAGGRLIGTVPARTTYLVSQAVD